MAHTHSTLVEVRRTPGKGLGVYARRAVARATVIERVPVIVLPEREVFGGAGGSTLPAYVFHWSERRVALALGYGSLYNHSFRPNAAYERSGPRTLAFVALRDLAGGEEITIDYLGAGREESELGFDAL